jgi:hypothetical protein
MIYVASVYSLDAKSNNFKDAMTRQFRYEYTMKRVAQLLKQGEHAYSPIVHGHEMGKVFNFPKSYQFWQDNDRHMIDLCDKVVVLKMEGWQRSEGVCDEIRYAESLGKTVEYLDCDDHYDPYDS